MTQYRKSVVKNIFKRSQKIYLYKIIANKYVNLTRVNFRRLHLGAGLQIQRRRRWRVCEHGE